MPSAPASPNLPGFVHRAFAELRDRRSFHALDACLLSYPKCGRTWLRLMLGEALQTQFGVACDDPTDILSISRAIPEIATVQAWHDDNPMWKSIDELETDKGHYRRKRVIFLVRDPRDVAVSSYFHHTRRGHRFEGDLEDFLERKRIVEKVCRFYNIWDEQGDRAKAFLLVRYEDLHEDPAHELVRVLRFLGLSEPEEAAVDGAIASGSFDHMHALEASGAVPGHRLRPGAVDDPESFKTRRGVVGGFSDYMTPEQIQATSAAIRELLSPRFGYPVEDYTGQGPG